jgi:RNA polymerase sigma factor (TIGR02999 family)
MNSADHNCAENGGSVEVPDDPNARSMLALMYDELRRLAAGYLRSERPDHTLQPTALVHEAYLKLLNQTSAAWRDPRQFRALAATAMRQILVDHARRRRSAKRGGAAQRITLDEALTPSSGQDVQLLALDEALGRLNALDKRQGRVVELRFFGGLTNEEVAEVLGVSRATVANDWTVARAWLSREIDQDEQE